MDRVLKVSVDAAGRRPYPLQAAYEAFDTGLGFEVEFIFGQSQRSTAEDFYESGDNLNNILGAMGSSTYSSSSR